MGERERSRTDLRAVRLGAVRGTLVFGITYAGGWVFGLAINPVLRDLARGVSVPDGWTLGVVAAVVGVPFGWGRMRASRRIVGPAGAGAHTYRDGDGNAIGRALANARASAAAGGRGGRIERAGRVQRWSDDLLTGPVGVPDEGQLMDAGGASTPVDGTPA